MMKQFMNQLMKLSTLIICALLLTGCAPESNQPDSQRSYTIIHNPDQAQQAFDVMGDAVKLVFIVGPS